MEHVAVQLNVDPLELRVKNFLQVSWLIKQCHARQDITFHRMETDCSLRKKMEQNSKALIPWEKLSIFWMVLREVTTSRGRKRFKPSMTIMPLRRKVQKFASKWPLKPYHITDRPFLGSHALEAQAGYSPLSSQICSASCSLQHGWKCGSHHRGHWNGTRHPHQGMWMVQANNYRN